MRIIIDGNDFSMMDNVNKLKWIDEYMKTCISNPEGLAEYLVFLRRYAKACRNVAIYYASPSPGGHGESPSTIDEREVDMKIDEELKRQ